jgi:hypothetical protein
MNVYSTKDLSLVAALICRRHVMLGMDLSDSSRVVFNLDETPELLSDIQEFWNGTLMVSARHYFAELRMLKNQLHSNDCR